MWTKKVYIVEKKISDVNNTKGYVNKKNGFFLYATVIFP
jgi:hypothetical protein